ncbi:MAG TPA: TlpA disulfide reductase family protein [Lacipirellulaceae bacterium]
MYLTCKRWVLSFVTSWCLLTSATRADRPEEYAHLEAEFEAAVEKLYASPKTAERTTAERIRDYEAAPLWQFVPRFLALAEANPGDETAYRCCKWILHYNLPDQEMVEPHRRVWKILADHHAQGEKLPELCFLAVQNFGPTQEDFLRGQLKREDLAPGETAYATLALAELLARRVEYLEYRIVASKLPIDDFVTYLESRYSPDWTETMNVANRPKFKEESMRVLRVVLDKYADVPNSLSMPYFRDIGKLGDKASKSLHALEHLSLGAEAPDIVGTDLDGNQLKLRDYRGRVVLLSFWFAGCGPCMQMVPKERELVEKFKDRPFSLLAICTDGELEVGRAAVEQHDMTWPCWFDGDNGPIARDYNILSWPTFYLLDKNGRIISNDLPRDNMDVAIEKLLNGTWQ